MHLNLVPDHHDFNFLDEKHYTNHNNQEIKVRADPLIGVVEGISVQGDFCDSKTVIACVLANPNKPKHVFHTIGWETNNACLFMIFVELMISNKFL